MFKRVFLAALFLMLPTVAHAQSKEKYIPKPDSAPPGWTLHVKTTKFIGIGEPKIARAKLFKQLGREPTEKEIAKGADYLAMQNTSLKMFDSPIPMPKNAVMPLGNNNHSEYSKIPGNKQQPA